MSSFKHQRQAFLGHKISNSPWVSYVATLRNIGLSIYRFPRNIGIFLIRVYRFLLSPDHSFWAKALNKPPYCKHFPSCSSFALEALERHGAIRGWFYSIRRIIACNPWSKWGFDPVPGVVKSCSNQSLHKNPNSHEFQSTFHSDSHV